MYCWLEKAQFRSANEIVNCKVANANKFQEEMRKLNLNWNEINLSVVSNGDLTLCWDSTLQCHTLFSLWEGF